MDVSKKRKADENGADNLTPLQETQQTLTLTRDDAKKLLEPFTHDQLLSLLTDAVSRHSDVLSSARALADSDVSRRKLFVRGLGPDTTTEALKTLYSSFGELDEAVVITDKGSGKSKGYGFVTFKHVDGAVLALREPSKRIDGRMTVTHLASAGRGPNTEDQATRKIYVGNVPFELGAEKLLDYFSAFGEIEEGPLGFDKQGGKLRGFAFFVYKTEAGARASLMEPMKVIDGHQVMCKLAEDGKKAKVGNMGGPVNVPNSGGFEDRIGQNPMNHGFGMSGYGPSPAMSGPGNAGYNQPPPYSGVSQYSGPGGAGDFASYRMPPPSSIGMPMSMPPPSGGPYSQDGLGGGYNSGLSLSGYTAPPSQLPPPQVPPGGYRMPPYY